MSQLNFWQHLQFQVKYAPVSETDDDLEKWKKRSQVIDNEVEKSGISNPTFVKIAKDRLLGQRPPTYSALENIAEDLPTGFARGTYGSFTKSVGAGLSAPRASVMDDLQPFFDRGTRDEVTGEIREYTQEEKDEFATKYLSNELPHPFIPTFLSPKRKDIYDRPEKPEWLQELGTNLYEHGKEFRERWQGEGRAATNEEYIRKAYSPSGDIVEKLFAKAIQRGWVNSPSELARSTGESVASLGAGVAAGTAGFLAGGPRGAAAGFMAGATMQASLQVADGVGESVENDEEIKKLVEQTVLQKYTTEQLANEDIRDKVKEETDDKMQALGKFWTSETIQRRLGSPATLLELIGAYPLGNIVARAILDTGAEAGSEAYDTALEETVKLNAKEDLLQELGVPQSEIDEVLNYETIAGLRINDWMKVVRGGTAGAILGAGTTAPTIAIEEAGKLAVNTLKKSSDPRIDPDRTAQKTLRDQEMIDTKEEAYVEQVRLQGLDTQVKGLDAEAKAETARLNAEREKEKTEQERIKARLRGYLEGEPEEQLALDQQVETTSDQVTPDLPDLPDEFEPSSTAEDIRVLSELTPEEVREEEDRVDPRLAPQPETAPDERAQLEQSILDDHASYDAEYRETGTAPQVSEDEAGNTTLRSVSLAQDGSDKNLEAIPSPISQNEPRDFVHRNTKATTEAIVKLFARRFPKLGLNLGENVLILTDDEYRRYLDNRAVEQGRLDDITIQGVEDFAQELSRASDYVPGTEGHYEKGTGRVVLNVDNISAAGEQRNASDRLVEVLWHEALGHKGLIEGLNDASTDGKGYNRFINAFLDSYQGDPVFNAYVSEVGLEDNRFGAAEEFIVQKFREGNVFNLDEEGNLYESIDTGENRFSQGSLENKFLDSLVASFKAAIGRDGVNKGRLDDRQIRHIMLALKLKNMGQNVLGRRPVISFEDQDDSILESDPSDQTVTKETTDADGNTILHSLDSKLPEGYREITKFRHVTGDEWRWEFNLPPTKGGKKDRTFQIRAFRAKATSDTVGGASTFTAFDDKTGVATESKPLYEVDSEFKRKIDSANIDPNNEDAYVFDFGKLNPRSGKISYLRTKEGSEKEIMSQVVSFLKEFLGNVRPKQLIYTGKEETEDSVEGKVPAINRLYTRINQRMADEFGYPQNVEHLYNGDLEGIFILQDAPAEAEGQAVQESVPPTPELKRFLEEDSLRPKERTTQEQEAILRSAARTPEFRKFFRDNKLTADLMGGNPNEPLMVYHGARDGFEGKGFRDKPRSDIIPNSALSLERKRREPFYYVTTSPSDAERFSGFNKRSVILPLFAKIEKPFIFTNEVYQDWSETITGQRPPEYMNLTSDSEAGPHEIPYRIAQMIWQDAQFFQGILNEGYDGAIFRGGISGKGKHIVALALPKNLKSQWNAKPTEWNPRDILRSAPQKFKRNWYGDEGLYDPSYVSEVKTEELKGDTGEVIGTREVPQFESGIDFTIPDESEEGLLYRGMSDGEYQEFVKTGEVKSAGSYNIGEQAGLTYYSTSIQSAEAYADRFAPSQFQPSFEKPAYVVAINAPDAKYTRHVEGVGEHEVGVSTPIPSKDIVAIYKGEVIEHRPGTEGEGISVAPSSKLSWKKIFDQRSQKPLGREPVINAIQSPLYRTRTPEEVKVLSDDEARRIVRENDKTAARIFGKKTPPVDGDIIGARLNLNIMKNTGVPVQAIHIGTRGRKTKEGYSDRYKSGENNVGFYKKPVIDYRGTVTIRDAYFNVDQKMRDKVAVGLSGKDRLASVDGTFADIPPNFDGIEIMFNPGVPKRGIKGVHLFTDTNNRPIKSAGEVTISGTRGYARGRIEYFKKSEAPRQISSLPFPSSPADSDVLFSKKPVQEEKGALDLPDAPPGFWEKSDANYDSLFTEEKASKRLKYVHDLINKTLSDGGDTFANEIGENNTIDHENYIADLRVFSSEPVTGSDRLTGEEKKINPATALYMQTKTPKFRKFYRGSRLVNTDKKSPNYNKPIMLFHGTFEWEGKGFKNKFRGRSTQGLAGAVGTGLNTGGILGHGFYFTSNLNVAESYATTDWNPSGEGGFIIPVYVSIQNPLEVQSRHPLLRTRATASIKPAIGTEISGTDAFKLIVAAKNIGVDLGLADTQAVFKEKWKPSWGYEWHIPGQKIVDKGLLDKQIVSLGDMIKLFSAYNADISSIVQRAGFDGIIEYGSENRGLKEPIYNPALKEEVPDIQQVIVYDNTKIKSAWNLTPKKSGDLLRSLNSLRTLKSVPGDSRPLNSIEVDGINEDLQSLLRSASNRIRRVRWGSRPESEKTHRTSTGKKYSLHRLHDRVSGFRIHDDPATERFKAYAVIHDIVGGLHEFEFHADYRHMDPLHNLVREAGLSAGRASDPTNKELFELRQSDNPPWRNNPNNSFQKEAVKILEKGFSFKRMHDSFGVVFKIDDSFSILNHEVTDPDTGESRDALVNRPAWSAMNNALIAFIETAKPAFLSFSAEEASRVSLYTNHMAQIGEVYGYAVHDTGDKNSKVFYMQKLWETEEEYYLNHSKTLNLFMPGHPDYKAFSNLEVTELAQLGFFVEKYQERGESSLEDDTGYVVEAFTPVRDFAAQAQLPIVTGLTTETMFRYMFDEILGAAPSFKDGVLQLKELEEEIEVKQEEYGDAGKGADNFNAIQLIRALDGMARYLKSFKNNLSIKAAQYNVIKNTESAHNLLVYMATFGRTNEIQNIRGRPQTPADALYTLIEKQGFPKAIFPIFQQFMHPIDGARYSGWETVQKIIRTSHASGIEIAQSRERALEIHSFVRNLQNLQVLIGVVDANAILTADAIYEPEDFLAMAPTSYDKRNIQYDGEKDRFLLLDFSDNLEGEILGQIAFIPRPLGGDYALMLTESNTSHYKPKLGQPLTLDSFIDFLTAKTDPESLNNATSVSPIFSAPIEETIEIINKISRIQRRSSSDPRITQDLHYALSEDISYDQLLGVLHYDTNLLLGLSPEGTIADMTRPSRVQPASVQDTAEEARARLEDNLRGEYQTRPRTYEEASTRYPYIEEDTVIASNRAIIENIRNFLIADSNSYRITASDVEILATARPDLQQEIMDSRNKMRYTTAARMGEEAIAEAQESRRLSYNRITMPPLQEFLQKLMPYFKTPQLTPLQLRLTLQEPHVFGGQIGGRGGLAKGFYKMVEFRRESRRHFEREVSRGDSSSPNTVLSPKELIHLWFAVQFAKHRDFISSERGALWSAVDFDPEADTFRQPQQVSSLDIVAGGEEENQRSQRIADAWNKLYDYTKTNSNIPVFKYLDEMLANSDPEDTSWITMVKGQDEAIENPLFESDKERIRNEQQPASVSEEISNIVADADLSDLSELALTAEELDLEGEGDGDLLRGEAAFRQRLTNVSRQINTLRAAEELTISEGASQVDPETLESVINFAISDLESPRMYDPAVNEFVPWAPNWWGFSAPEFINLTPTSSAYGSQTNIEENLQERIDALNAMLARYRELGLDDSRIKSLHELVELHGDEIPSIDIALGGTIASRIGSMRNPTSVAEDETYAEDLDLETALDWSEIEEQPDVSEADASEIDAHIARTYNIDRRLEHVVGRRSTRGTSLTHQNVSIIANSDYRNMSEDDHLYMVKYLEENSGSKIYTRGTDVNVYANNAPTVAHMSQASGLTPHPSPRNFQSNFYIGLLKDQSRDAIGTQRGVATLGPELWSTVIHALKQLKRFGEGYDELPRFAHGIDADSTLISDIMSAEDIRGPSESSTWQTNPIIGRGLWLRHRYFNLVIENLFMNPFRKDSSRQIPINNLNVNIANRGDITPQAGFLRSFPEAVDFYSDQVSSNFEDRVETIRQLISRSFYQSTQEFYSYLSANETKLLDNMYDVKDFASEVIGNKLLGILWTRTMLQQTGAGRWIPMNQLLEGAGTNTRAFISNIKEDLSIKAYNAVRAGRQQNSANEDLAILRSVRQRLPMTRLDTELDTTNKLNQSFEIPDGDKIHISSNAFISTPLAGGVLDSKELEDAGTRAGLNIHEPMNVWNINFNSERNGPDIIGKGEHIHRIANGVKQFLGRLVEQKNPDVIKLSAFDPSFILGGSEKKLRLNNLKGDSRISVYKFAAQQIGRDYGYKLFLRRVDWDAGLIVLQREEFTAPKFSNIVEEYNNKTGESISWDSLRNWQRSFSEITESYLNSEYASDRELPPYNVLKLGLSEKAKMQLTKLHDAIPEFMRGTYKKEITNFVINDIVGKKAEEPTGRLQNTILRSREDKPLHSSEFPSVDRTMRSLKAKSGEPETAFGRWASNVMNYLKGKHLGNLEEEDKYLIGRYRALGKVAEMTEMGERFYKAFKDARYTKEIYEFLTTKGADPAMIPDDAERKNAIDAKEKIIRIGEDLADLGMLPQSTLTKLKGQYLPRIYLTHLLKDETVKALQGGGRPSTSQLDYLKHRRDIPKAVRELLLREIKDPDYLVGRALMIPGRDIALMNWYSDLAQNSKWAYQASVVEFDTLKEVQSIIRNMPGVDSDAVMKLFELDPSIEDRRNSLKERIRFVQSQIRTTKDKDLKEVLRRDLENLKDTYKLLKPRKVSGEYLVNEAARIRKDILPTLDGQARDIGKELAKRMDSVGEEHKKEDYDQRYWRKMPNTKRFGRLRGMIVRREIYDDIVGSQKIVQNENPDLIDEVFGEGGHVERAGQLWKWSKVAGNFPPSHVRNFTSNMILMHLGGVPGESLPGLLVKAVRELATNGEHYKIAKRYGLKGSSFSANELGKIEKEFTELKRRLDKGKVSWLPGTFGALRRGFEGIKETTSVAYELMEALGKTMMIIDGINRLKLSEEEAVIRAQKYLFDYSLLPGWARKVRRAALGAPFLTFYYKTLPVLIETMRYRPWKLAPYFLLGSGMQYAAKAALDLDDDEYEALKKSLPEWLRNKPHVYVLPWKDEHGRVQWVDASYLMPWGMFTALLQEMSPVDLSRLIDVTPDVETKTPSVKNIFGTLGLMTGPVPSTISATLTGIDPFTRRPIWNERDSAGDQILSAGLYAYNLSMPTLWAGLPDLMLHSDQQRLQGGVRKLWGAARNELNNRGLPKDTIKQSWLRFSGINIYGFEPKQARKDSLFNMRRNLRDAQRDMRIEIRNMSRRGKTLDEISDRRSELINRVKNEQLKLREYTAATRKVVNL